MAYVHCQSHFLQNCLKSYYDKVSFVKSSHNKGVSFLTVRFLRSLDNAKSRVRQAKTQLV